MRVSRPPVSRVFGGLPAPLTHPLAQPPGWAKVWDRGGLQPPKTGESGGRAPKELNLTLT
jgi:hypothetical protein